MEQKAAIEHALMFIPEESPDDIGDLYRYHHILNALLGNFDQNTAVELLAKKLNGNLEATLNQNEFDIYDSNIDNVYRKAGEFGWSINQYIKYKNANGNAIEFESEYRLPNYDKADTHIHERFVGDSKELKELNKKNLIIHSSHGTGKTEFVLSQLQGKNFIYITHREQLAREICARLNEAGIEVAFYKDLSPIEYEEYSGNLVICINSIHKLDKSHHKNKIIVIDEFDQFVHHIHGDTCKNARPQIFNRFKDIVSKSKGCMFLSADFPDLAINFIRKVLKIKEYHYVFNTFVPNSGRDLCFHSSEKSIISQILNVLNRGEKVSIACFSKTNAEKIALALKQVYKGTKKIIYIVHDNKFYPEQRALLENKELAKDYDAIIFSPVLSSGVDFNIEFSRYNFLLVNEHTVKIDHFEALQMAHRFRNYEELHVLCDKRPFSPENYIVATTHRFLERLREFLKKHSLYKQMILSPRIRKKAKGAYAFIINALLCQLYKEHSLQFFYRNLLNGFLRRGYNVDFVDVYLDFGEDIEAEVFGTYEEFIKFYCPEGSGGGKSQIARQIEMELTYEMIQEVKSLSKSEYLRIKKKGVENRVEAEQICVYEIKSALGYVAGDFQSEDDLRTYFGRSVSVAKFSEQIWNFKLLKADLSVIETVDKFFENKTMQHDYESISMKSKYLKEIWSRVAEGEFKGETLSTLMDYVKVNRTEISACLLSVADSYFEKPVNFVSKFFMLMGVRLDGVQKTKKKLKIYWPKKMDIEFNERVILRRKEVDNN
ncbi:plasmid replication protein, CyRepA1 family [Leptospira interrogans]|uniref:plasmid replication protein, CyRepA1 family n=1 Tax=Leptospira interrogans TaxID=173 RepID=UPI001E6234A6|nr:plasmid replication protein, CyRepA1 family [Leptospira interrogans]